MAHRRRRSRRRRTRRNPHYVVVNRKHRRRRMRRNALVIYGKDVVKDIAMPAGVATAGFVGANALSNWAAGMDGIRNLLDAGKSPEQAVITKSVVNGVGILGLLGAAQVIKAPLLRENVTPALTGMGLSLLARLLRGVPQIAPYLGRLGEYVEQPMGEYVSQPMGAYVQDPSHGTGEYVEQPVSGLGTLYAAAGYPEGQDPADQEGIDSLMDVMEAAAGVPMQAAAGMGTLYAAAGLGGPATGEPSLPQPPFASISTPTDMAAPVTKVMPADLPIPTSLVTPEGRGFAGGLFARHLFAGMF